MPSRPRKSREIFPEILLFLFLGKVQGELIDVVFFHGPFKVNNGERADVDKMVDESRPVALKIDSDTIRKECYTRERILSADSDDLPRRFFPDFPREYGLFIDGKQSPVHSDVSVERKILHILYEASSPPAGDEKFDSLFLELRQNIVNLVAHLFLPQGHESAVDVEEHRLYSAPHFLRISLIEE